jgi:hypothetical protein
MKRNHVLLAAFFLMHLVTANVFAGDFKDKFKGKWEVIVPEGGEEYQKFTVEIKEKGDSLVYDIRGKDTDLKNQKFTEENGKLVAHIYVGAYYKVTLWEENGKIKGTVANSSITMSCYLKKPEK